MRAFDLEVWRRRAWDRFTRGVRAGGDAKILEEGWAAEMRAVADLSVLVGWCASRGLTVLFGKKQNAAYDPTDKTIVVSCHARPERQLIYMLHECGHHLIGAAEHHTRFGMGYPQTDPAVTRTFLHRVSCLEEELEAWHRGWKLCLRLRLSLQRTAFDKVRLECIKSYISWSLHRDRATKQEDEDGS